MHDATRFAAAIAVLVALAAAPAYAAAPVPDARYGGQTSQGQLRFEFRTSVDGSEIERLFTQFRTPNCDNADNGAQGSIRARDINLVADEFVAEGRETVRLPAQGGFDGGTQVERYRISGRFPTSDRARGTMRVTVKVKNRAGDVIATCRHGKRITWVADRLGVDIED